MQMGLGILRESCSNENISPIGLGLTYRALQFFKASSAEFEHSESDSLKPLWRDWLPERQTVSALLLQYGGGLSAVSCAEDFIDSDGCLGRQIDHCYCQPTGCASAATHIPAGRCSPILLRRRRQL